MIIIYVAIYEFYLIYSYSDYYHRQIETIANMDEIGIVSMEDMGTIPFFSVHYMGHRLKRTNDTHCIGEGVNGDCFAFVTNYLKIKWNNPR